MNLKKGFRRVVLIFAIFASLICMFTVMGVLIHKKDSAKKYLKKCEQEFIKSIPVASDDDRPFYFEWPRWQSEKDGTYSDHLDNLSGLLLSTQVNLPLLYGEEDKKYREENNIPPDSTDRFYTKESAAIMRAYGKCFQKAVLLQQCPRFWLEMSSGGFAVLLVLASLGSGAVSFISFWIAFHLLLYLFKWIALGFCEDKNK